MSEVHGGTCPLCNMAANVQDHVMRRSRHYICQSCGELVVKCFAEDWLRAKAPDRARQDFAAEAKGCSSGNVYFISQSRGADRTQHTVGKCLPLTDALLV